MNAPAQNLKAHVAHYGRLNQDARAALVRKVEREEPLIRALNARCYPADGRQGPPDFRPAISKVFSRMAASGQPFVVIEEGEGDE